MVRFIIYPLLVSVILAAAADDATRVVAEYQTEVKSPRSKVMKAWRFIRNGNHVTHQHSNRTLRWTRLSEREIGLEQIFSKEKIVLEFKHSELRSSGEDLSWSSIAHLVDTNLLSRLSVTGSKKNMGRTGTVYKGRIDGALWEVLWFHELKLAGRITRRDKNGTIRTEITKWVEGETNDEDLRGFRRVDYADLGHLESDPAIQKLLSSIGSPHGHNGHALH